MVNQVRDGANLPDFVVRAHAAQFAILREADEFLDGHQNPSVKNRFQMRLQQPEEAPPEVVGVAGAQAEQSKSDDGAEETGLAWDDEARAESKHAHEGQLGPGRSTSDPRIVTRHHLSLVRDGIREDLQAVRVARDKTVNLHEAAGLLAQEQGPLLRTLHWNDGRIDELWTAWLNALEPSSEDDLMEAELGTLPTPWDWAEVERTLLVDRDRRTQLRLLATGALMALLLLIGTFWWSANSASAASYVAMFASAIGCSALTFLRWRRSTRAFRLWQLTLAPLVILTLGLGLMVSTEAASPGEATALAASVVVVLIAFAISAVFSDIDQVPRIPVRTAPAPHPHPLRASDATYARLLSEYLHELRVAILREATDRKTSSNRWNRSFLIVGGLAAMLSAGAGFSGLSDSLGEYVAIAALFGAGLTAFVTLVNPSQRSEKANAIALSCQSLADEIEMLLRFDLARESKDRGLQYVRSQVEKVSEQFDALREVPQRPRLWERRTGEPIAPPRDA